MERKKKNASQILLTAFEDNLSLHNDMRRVIEAEGTKIGPNPRTFIVKRFVDEWEKNWNTMNPRMRRAILRRAALKLFAEVIDRIQREILAAN